MAVVHHTELRKRLDSRAEQEGAEQARASAEQLLAGVREELQSARQMLEGEQAQCTRYA